MDQENTNVAESNNEVIDPANANQGQPPVSESASEQQSNDQGQPNPEYTEFSIADGVQLDQTALGEFKSFAAEANLSQEQAQQVVDMGVKLQQKWATEQSAAMQKSRDQWAEASNNDQEFGGPKLQENLAIAKQALDKFGTPEFTQLLADSGLGNHPEVIRFIYRAGKAISNDKFVGGGGANNAPVDPAKVLFPNMK